MEGNSEAGLVQQDDRQVGPGERNGRDQTLVRQIPLAAQPEIMRAAEKDDHYSSYVYEACHESVRHVFGTRFAVAFQNETRLAGQMLYYIMTTGAGLQTLGEEYCDLVQIGGSSGLPPTPAKRISLVFLQTALPYLAEKLSARIATQGMLLAYQNQEGVNSSVDFERSQNESILQNSVNDPHSLSATRFKSSRWLKFTESLRKLFSAGVQKWPMVLPIAREGIHLVIRANLMLFYFEGLYYHLGKRAAGVRYAFIGKQLQQRPRYHILGLFLLIQLCIIGADRIRQSNISSIANAMRSFTMSGDTYVAAGKSPIVLAEDGKPLIESRIGGGDWASSTKFTSECRVTYLMPNLCFSFSLVHQANVHFVLVLENSLPLHLVAMYFAGNAYLNGVMRNQNVLYVGHQYHTLT